MPLVVATVAAPWGPVAIATSGAGVVATDTVTADDLADRLAEERRHPVMAWDGRVAEPAGALLERAIAAVEAFLGGDPAPLAAVPVDLDALRPFDRDVLTGVRTIPAGRVTSYGRLAALVGRPGAARAVGGAVGRSPIGLFVPCHRVIAGDGSLGGYGGDGWGGRERGLAVKRELLRLEGVEVPVPREALLGPGGVSAG